MSNPYIGWVNFQLVAVRHHLTLLKEESSANEKLRNRGVLESAVWHLKRAYRYYLFELGANYQLPSPEANLNAGCLSEALDSVGKHPGEASELSQLEADGWIGDLIQALESAEFSNGVITPQSSSAELNLVDLDRQRATLSLDILEQWLAKFKELIDRHRTMMVEY